MNINYYDLIKKQNLQVTLSTSSIGEQNKMFRIYKVLYTPCKSSFNQIKAL